MFDQGQPKIEVIPSKPVNRKNQTEQIDSHEEVKVEEVKRSSQEQVPVCSNVINQNITFSGQIFMPPSDKSLIPAQPYGSSLQNENAFQSSSP